MENVINSIVTRGVSGKILKYWNIYISGFMLWVWIRNILMKNLER